MMASGIVWRRWHLPLFAELDEDRLVTQVTVEFVEPVGDG